MNLLFTSQLFQFHCLWFYAIYSAILIIYAFCAVLLIWILFTILIPTYLKEIDPSITVHPCYKRFLHEYLPSGRINILNISYPCVLIYIPVMNYTMTRIQESYRGFIFQSF